MGDDDHFRGIILVRKDSGIKEISDFVAAQLTQAASTSGSGLKPAITAGFDKSSHSKGSVTVNGEYLGPNSLRFVQADEHPVPLKCGPEGATVTVLTYDQDADQSYGGSILQDMADLENRLISGNAY